MFKIKNTSIVIDNIKLLKEHLISISYRLSGTNIVFINATCLSLKTLTFVFIYIFHIPHTKSTQNKF